MSKSVTKGIVLTLAIAGIALVIGGMISSTFSRKAKNLENAGPAIASNEATEITEATNETKEEPFSEPWLGTIAVADINLLLTAHSWTKMHKQELDRERAAIPRDADQRTRQLMNLTIDSKQRENRKLVVKDVQKFVALYARTHGFKLILDRSTQTTNGVPPVLYPAGVTNLDWLANSPHRIDITQEVLQELKR